MLKVVVTVILVAFIHDETTVNMSLGLISKSCVIWLCPLPNDDKLRRAFRETNSPLVEHLPPLPGKGQVN